MRCTAAVSLCVAWSCWLVILCRLGALSSLSNSLLFLERDWNTILFEEYLQGKPALTALSSFCAVNTRPLHFSLSSPSSTCLYSVISNPLFQLSRSFPIFSSMFDWLILSVHTPHCPLCIWSFLFSHYPAGFVPFFYLSFSLLYPLPIPTGRGCSPLTWLLRL